MKKTLMLIAIAALAAGSVFAQEGEEGYPPTRARLGTTATAASRAGARMKIAAARSAATRWTSAAAKTAPAVR